MLVRIGRWALYILLIPFSLVVAVLILVGLSLVMEASGIKNFWYEPLAAVIFPIVGLTSSWFAAPTHKPVAMGATMCIGILFAYHFAFPSLYPEGYDLAYSPTYIPFTITVITALTTYIFLVWFHRANPNSFSWLRFVY